MIITFPVEFRGRWKILRKRKAVKGRIKSFIIVLVKMIGMLLFRQRKLIVAPMAKRAIGRVTPLMIDRVRLIKSGRGILAVVKMIPKIQAITRGL